jgi:cell division septum initiation protein DivIVA
MAATMSNPGASTPAQLRLTRHGYDPGDVDALLATARGRLARMAERLRRAEAANTALVAEVKRWKQRAREADAARVTFERALRLAEQTAVAQVAAAQAEASQLVERARCEAEHLVGRARVEARRAQASERRELRARAARLEAERRRLLDVAEGLEVDRGRLALNEEQWRHEVAWMATRMLGAVAQRRQALPAEGETSTPVTEVPPPLEHEWAEEEDETTSGLFERFMSPAIDDEPSREWVIGRA